jgi:pyridoxal phosphate enzyme (YggS family)
VNAAVQDFLASLPPHVTLIAVSKYATVPQILDAYHAGARHFGENRVQDALAKMAALPPDVAQAIHWHLIGPLQRNKINKIVGRFALIHSLDSGDIAQALSERTVLAGLVQPVLLQVNVSGEATKHGFAPQDLIQQVHTLLQLPGLQVKGLMTMAPHTSDSTQLTQCFTGLRQLRDTLVSETGQPFSELSMGMSGDYRQAIDCGATMVRIGQALFRPDTDGG